MLALSSLSSLLLLMLGTLLVLVLVRADGASWVRAALMHGLVCCTSCPTCSSVSCWAALICSGAQALQPGPPNKFLLWPAWRLLHHCFLRLLLNSFHFCLQQLCSVGCQLLLLCCFLLSCRCGKSCVRPAEISPLEQSVLLLLWLWLWLWLWLLLQSLLLGRGGGCRQEARGPLVACDLQRPKRLYFLHIPTGSNKL